MKIYLVRHGIAVERIGGAIRNDAQRPLTDEGREEMKLVARGLGKLGVKPDLIVSSPLVRARETAELIGEGLDYTGEYKITDSLAPAGATADVYKFLRQFTQSRVEEIFLVGHEPDIGRLTATLLWAGAELELPFKKAAIARVDVYDLPPTAPGVLKWFMTPKMATLIGQ